MGYLATLAIDLSDRFITRIVPLAFPLSRQKMGLMKLHSLKGLLGFCRNEFLAKNSGDCRAGVKPGKMIERKKGKSRKSGDTSEWH
jgi:hypothetical protein